MVSKMEIAFEISLQYHSYTIYSYDKKSCLHFTNIYFTLNLPNRKTNWIAKNEDKAKSKLETTKCCA